MLSLASALASQRRCYGDCHSTLTFEQRRLAVEAIYHCDDALRAWGYTPLYELHGDRLWREAQQKNDPAYRGVAVRFGECIYRRLVGSMLHEVLHALQGDTTRANYGIPFGMPYGVPVDVPEADEEAYLAPHNFAEATAFVRHHVTRILHGEVDSVLGVWRRTGALRNLAGAKKRNLRSSASRASGVGFGMKRQFGV